MLWFKKKNIFKKNNLFNFSFYQFCKNNVNNVNKKFKTMNLNVGFQHFVANKILKLIIQLNQKIIEKINFLKKIILIDFKFISILFIAICVYFLIINHDVVSCVKKDIPEIIKVTTENFTFYTNLNYNKNEIDSILTKCMTDKYQVIIGYTQHPRYPFLRRSLWNHPAIGCKIDNFWIFEYFSTHPCNLREFVKLYSFENKSGFNVDQFSTKIVTVLSDNDVYINPTNNETIQRICSCINANEYVINTLKNKI